MIISWINYAALTSDQLKATINIRTTLTINTREGKFVSQNLFSQ